MARRLDDARRGATLLAAADVVVGDLDSAYRVQDALTARRISRGGTRVGWKLGYTSEAMRAQLDITAPNFGPLLDTMLREDGAIVGPGLLQPRVEPEVALVLSRDVTEALEPDAALAVCSEAFAALEVVDSVWEGYRFDLEHNTADGSSAAHVVTGPTLPLELVADVGVALHRNGTLVGTGHGTAAAGHPARALAWLTGELARRRQPLRAGDIVITGGLTAAVPLEPGDVVHAEFDHPALGTRRVSVLR